MPEVISLLSSSPLPVLPSKPSRAVSSISQQDVNYSDLSFGEDAFNDVLDSTLPMTRSAKRRRLSPKPVAEVRLGSKLTITNVDAVYDLSSEGDIEMPKLPFNNLDTTSNLHNAKSLSNQRFALPSSPPKTRRRSTSRRDAVVDILSDDNVIFSDPILTSPQLWDFSKPSTYSKQTANILANLKKPTKSSNAVKKVPTQFQNAKVHSYAKTTKVSQSATVVKSATKVDDNIEDSSQAGPVQNGASTSVTVTRNITSKKQSKAQKPSTDKDAEKERRRQEREQKAAEKQLAADIAEVNKAKTNKKIAAKDMQIEMPNSMKGKSVSNQLEEFVKEAGATVTYYEEHKDLTSDSGTTTGHIVMWKRKVEAEYDKIKEEWVPIAKPKIHQEKHILLYLTAEEFCAIAACGRSGESLTSNSPPDESIMKNHIDDFIKHIRSQNHQATIVILIQGLSAYLKKSANAKNRDFAAAVRNQAATEADGESGPSTSATKRQKRKSASPIDLSFFTSDHSEAMQLHLQLRHRPLNIVHTTSPHTTAHQIFTLTQHLATRPYRLAAQQTNLMHASFCMDGGQIKTGQGDARETFILMLQEVNRITVSMAHGVLSQGYEGPMSLVKAFKALEQKEGKEASRLMLKDVRKAMNKDGGLSDKPLGQMVSKRLHKVFMSRDENMRDGIV